MKIKVCTGSACKDKFSHYILDRLNNDKLRFNLDKLEIEECMCLGQCQKGPNIVVDNDIKNYMNPAKASEFVFNTNSKKKNNNTKK